MDFKKREAELERIFYKNRMRLADLSNTAPINRQIILRIACLAWELKQKYRAKGVAYYVPKRSYAADLERIRAIESKLIQGGDSEAEANVAIAELKEYLELIAGYRVRDSKQNRVY